jgi:hypothetical protein
LNFFADFVVLLFLTAMNSPDVVSRQVLALPILVLVCDRFFTAPFRALSPTGLFTAIVASTAGIAPPGSICLDGAEGSWRRNEPPGVGLNPCSVA